MSMKCPNDGTTLVMSERVGVQIDYCPECRGVWLERGVLDRIIEHSGSRDERRDDHDKHDDHHDRHHEHHEHHDHEHHRHEDDEYDDHDKHDERHGRKRNRLSDIAGLFGGGED